MPTSDQAFALLERGDLAGGIAAMRTAAAAGEVDALGQMALWLLGGTTLPRDLPEARRLLARAAAAGHGGAAAMLVALTANGAGAPADWSGAVALLEQTAARDPAMTRQVALVRQRRLTADGAPAEVPEPELLSEAPWVARYAGLVSESECAEIAAAVAEIMEPARVADPRTGRLIAHPVRTSDGAVIGPTRENLAVRMVNLRLAAITGTDVAQGEALTVLRYAPGQEYRAHLDALPGEPNQRILTALVYLNAGYEGGETRFLANGLTVRGRPGDVLVFRNTGLDGGADQSALHAGLPVTRGVKWLATRWIRARPLDPWKAG